jgi:hypothetical protein
MLGKTICILAPICFLLGCAQSSREPAPAAESEQAPVVADANGLEAKMAREREALKTNTGIMPSRAERERREAAERQQESSLFASGNRLYSAPDQTSPSKTSPSSLFSSKNEVRFDGRPLTITSPSKGAHFRYGSSVSVSARAQDPMSIRSVAFYANDRIIGRASRHPYRCKWNVRMRGQVVLRVEALTKRNQTLTDSTAVFVDEKDLYMDRKYRTPTQKVD